MATRAFRGATQVDSDSVELIHEATAEMVLEVMNRNDIAPDDLISIFFTTTPDLVSDFPAYAARKMGLTDVPLMCAVEISVPDAMPRVIRMLAHAESDLFRAQVRHVYMRGAAALRTDLPQ